MLNITHKFKESVACASPGSNLNKNFALCGHNNLHQRFLLSKVTFSYDEENKSLFMLSYLYL